MTKLKTVYWLSLNLMMLPLKMMIQLEMNLSHKQLTTLNHSMATTSVNISDFGENNNDVN